MEKEGKMPAAQNADGAEKTEEDITVLKQLIDSLDEAEQKLETFYNKNDPENFNKAKKFITDIVNKISGLTK